MLGMVPYHIVRYYLLYSYHTYVPLDYSSLHLSLAGVRAFMGVVDDSQQLVLRRGNVSAWIRSRDARERQQHGLYA